MHYMIIGIIRGANKDNIEKVIQAAIDGGLENIEITLNTPNALELIAKASKKCAVGAGTVLSVDEAKAAIEVGAKFIVSPIADAATVKYCQVMDIPVYPCGVTPNEIYAAWKIGATMVKVFPAKSFGGPGYIKELKAPFNEIKLLACGGVNPQNIREYFDAGASAVAVGSSVFNKKWMDEGNFEAIKQRARVYSRFKIKIRSGGIRTHDLYHPKVAP
jgi:2-dehydro-3-deoxyphosphogluconate aldolase/(4S)-4-hydroxy-2-oxoglutarate aldolase